MTPERIAELRALANRLGEILPKTTLAELLDALEAVTRERDELEKLVENRDYFHRACCDANRKGRRAAEVALEIAREALEQARALAQIEYNAAYSEATAYDDPDTEDQATNFWLGHERSFADVLSKLPPRAGGAG